MLGTPFSRKEEEDKKEEECCCVCRDPYPDAMLSDGMQLHEACAIASWRVRPFPGVLPLLRRLDSAKWVHVMSARDAARCVPRLHVEWSVPQPSMTREWGEDAWHQWTTCSVTLPMPQDADTPWRIHGRMWEGMIPDVEDPCDSKHTDADLPAHVRALFTSWLQSCVWQTSRGDVTTRVSESIQQELVRHVCVWTQHRDPTTAMWLHEK
jgi:hypothetical protein